MLIEKKKLPGRKYTSYFALEEDDFPRKLKRPAVVFFPTKDHWNDFAFRTNFTYKILPHQPGNREHRGKIYLAFRGDENSPVDRVLSAIKSSSSKFLPSDIL